MENTLRWARIGLACAERPNTNIYIKELLTQSGLLFSDIKRSGEGENPFAGYRIIISVGDAGWTPQELSTLRDVIEEGGTLISIGATDSLSRLLGVAIEYPSKLDPRITPTLGEGYLSPTSDHPIVNHFKKPLHFFNGSPIRAEDSEQLATIHNHHNAPTDRAGITLRKIGEGRAICIAFNLPDSYVRITHGSSVVQDGMPADDGTAGINDNRLRSEDGGVLDWVYDRSRMPECEFPCFTEPIAEIHREILLRSILYSAHESGDLLPMLWYYPRNLNGLGLISVNVDDPNTDHARNLLHLSRLIGAYGTWFIRLPGYPLDIYRLITQHNHDIGLHFDAGENGGWSEDKLKIQAAHIKRVTAQNSLCGVNIHEDRWAGRDDFNHWCDNNEIKLNAGKGPSHAGNAGFMFGACRPFAFLDSSGIFSKSYVLPYIAKDPGTLVDFRTCQMLIDRTVERHGVAQFVIHPSLVSNEEAISAYRSIAVHGRNSKMEWWKAGDILKWERSRRLIKWKQTTTEQGAMLAAMADEKMEDAALLFLSPRPVSVLALGKQQSTEAIERYGYLFHSILLTLSAKLSLEMYLR